MAKHAVCKKVGFTYRFLEYVIYMWVKYFFRVYASNLKKKKNSTFFKYSSICTDGLIFVFELNAKKMIIFNESIAESGGLSWGSYL